MTTARPRSRRWRWILAGYALLLLASGLVQWQRPREVPGGRTFVEVARRDAEGVRPNAPRVRIGFVDTGEGRPLVLLHGSPGSADDFRSLVPHLAEGRRVIAIDLPGFGASDAWVPDYGIRTHAAYVLDVMDALDVERADVLGFSMGGGVAIEMTRLAPDRVRTLALWAGLGIQEGEGSGDYAFEHFKYAAGCLALVVAPELIPHFGMLGDRAARHAFIRNFWDTDQRPLRRALEAVDVPTLILHGRTDFLVPAWAAEAHHDLIAHSELVMFPEGHFMMFTSDGAATIAARLDDFLERHADDDAPGVRRTTDLSLPPDDASALPASLSIERGMNPWLEVSIIAGATFVSEDLTCVTVGLLVRRLQLDLFVGIVGCVLGIFLSDVGLWLVGRFIGRRMLRWRWVARRLPARRLEKAGRVLDAHLGKAVVASRFLPGTRVPLYVGAGMVGRRPVAFMLWLFVAALAWVPLVVVLVAIFGDVIVRPLERFFGTGLLTIVIAVGLLFLMVRTLTLLATEIGRARLAAKVARLWRWEFWPQAVFYLPLVPWVAWLSLTRRGFGTITAANPGIPHGGLVGESKGEIMSHLPAAWTVDGIRIDSGDAPSRVATLDAGMRERAWTFPIIMKPDIGERGAGVRRIADLDAARAYLEDQTDAVVAQTYHAGPYEAGIFYVRHPDDASGRIFSITDKHFTDLRGDGVSTVERLIWRHARYRMQAQTFLERHAGRLDDVLGADERLPLAVAGNHCQGTMFRDGAHLITPALAARIDEIAKTFAGFHFGRFDVRYADAEALKAGRDFAIIELNGITSESTNIYDPRRSLWNAYRTLFDQWRILFDIGAANRARGAKATPLGEILRLLWVWRRRGGSRRSD